MHPNRGVAVGSSEVQGHVHGLVGVRDVLHLLSHYFTPLGIFFFELGDECFGSLGIHGFEGILGVVRHAVCHERNRGQHRDKKNQENFVAETHG